VLGPRSTSQFHRDARVPVVLLAGRQFRLAGSVGPDGIPREEVNADNYVLVGLGVSWAVTNNDPVNARWALQLHANPAWNMPRADSALRH